MTRLAILRAIIRLLAFRAEAFYETRLSHRRLFSAQQWEAMRKLNLGASHKILPGWVNVDARPLPDLDYVTNAKDLFIFHDESFDIVRASHLLEHFYPGEIPAVLREWTRVLKPGGWLIVCVPSFDGVVYSYLANPDSINICRDDFRIDMLNWILGLISKEDVKEDPFFKHRTIFNFESLKEILEKYAGLKNVRRYNFRLEPPFTLGILDDSCSILSLNVVGQKAGQNA